MTEVERRPPSDDVEREISAFEIGSALLRWRRMIVILAVLGGAIGLTRGLASTRVYKSAATFIPQNSQSTSGLALAASQFGINVGSPGGAWSAPMYVELLRSRAVLEPIVLDTFTVAEDGGRRAPLIDLLGVTAPTPERRLTGAVQLLGQMVQSGEDKKLGAVRVSVATKWPSVSLAVVERLVQRIDRFNIETRKSQALSERQWAEKQVAESRAALRDAEDRLESFLQRNRNIEGSPSLSFTRDRLQREVVRLNQLYTSWLQSFEEARIREIRDTPVITVLEAPRLPFIGEPRKTVQRAIVGFLGGMVLGVLIAFLREAWRKFGATPTPQAREFFSLLHEATPGFLTRRRKAAPQSE